MPVVEEIQAIRERHEATVCSPDYYPTPEQQDYLDIGTLLEFVRAVANLPPDFVHGQGATCPIPRCGYPLSDPGHASNKSCLWLIAQGAVPR